MTSGISLVSPPTTIIRRPILTVVVDGTPLPDVLEATTTRGLDQDIATASITVKSGLRSNVLKYSQVEIYMGATAIGAAAPRFNGYIVDWQAGLWPGTMTLLCEDPLALAKGYYNPTPIDQKNKTDTSAVRQILETAGFDPDQIDLEGGGKKIGKLDEASNLWDIKTSALERIKQIDSISYGYRTFALTSGRIVRRFIGLVPGDDFSHHYQEGLDILEGSLSSEKVDPANQISIEGTGIKGTSTSDADPKQWRRSPYFKRLKALKQQSVDADYLNFDELSAYLLARMGKWLIKVSFSTHVEELYQFGDILKVTAAHLDGVAQTFWIQTVSASMSQAGAFTNSFTLVSEMLPTMRGVQHPLSGGTPLPASPTPPPVAPMILADFLVGPVLVEQVIVADAYVTLYDLLCTDTSTSPVGQIVSWAWTVSGGGGLPASGSDRYLTVTCTDLTACVVALTVTDSLGNTGTVTRPLNAVASSRRYRKLYDAATAVAEAWDGFTWRTQPPSSGNVVGVAPGPVWWNDDDPGLVLHSDDDLRTAATPTTPFAGEAVSAAWIELDISASRVAAGGALGSLAVSSDATASWVLRNDPTGADPVLRVYISRFNPSEFHVLTANAYFTSFNGGASWSTRLAAAVSEVFNDLCLSHTRNMLASNQGVRNVGAGTVGTLLTGITAGRNVVSIQPDIKVDRFYAIDSTGATWIMASDGATAFSAGSALPGGVQGLVRATHRDGTVAKVIYIAGGTGGLWKTTDGHASSGGYHQLRKPSVLGAGTGPWLMVGAGELATEQAAEPVLLYAGSTVGFWTKETGTWVNHGFPDVPGAWDSIYSMVGIPQVPGGAICLGDRSDGKTGVAKTSDYGATWTDIRPSGWAALTVSAPKIVALTTTDWYINARDDGVDGGLWRTQDSGTSWTRIIAGTVYSPDNNLGQNGVFDVRGNVLWYGARATTAGTTNGIHRAAADGSSIVDLNINGRQSGSVRGSPETALRAWAFDNGGGQTPIVKRIDTSTITTVTPSGLSGSSQIPWLEFRDDDVGILEVTNPGTLLRTADGGGTWSDVTPAWGDFGGVREVIVYDGATWWALAYSGQGRLWLSTDDGLTWTEDTTLDIGAGEEIFTIGYSPL